MGPTDAATAVMGAGAADGRRAGNAGATRGPDSATERREEEDTVSPAANARACVCESVCIGGDDGVGDGVGNGADGEDAVSVSAIVSNTDKFEALATADAGIG
jgi:hypothetical protein